MARRVLWLPRTARRSAKRTVIRAGGALSRRLLGGTVPPVVTYCVYRARNASLVSALLSGLPAGARVNLHRLEHEVGAESDRMLAAKVVSQGSGFRTPLLRQMIEAHPPRPGDYVLIVDDDVRFEWSGMRDFLRLARSARLVVSQPAHSQQSEHTHAITGARPFSAVRCTNFVEIGPVVLLSPRAQRFLLPLPPDAAMGWGLDVQWARIGREQGLRFGIVDVTPVMHTGSVARDYERSSEMTTLSRALAKEGVASVDQFARNIGIAWRPWRRKPPWLVHSEPLEAEDAK